MTKRLPPGVWKTTDHLPQMQADLALLIGTEVMVGFPEESTDRQPDETGSTPPTNAALGFIHDNGAPEVNIPARPFMTPGIESVETKVADRLVSAADMVFSAPPRAKAAAMDVALHRVGLVAETGLKKKINEGVPPPLSEYTLAKRAAKGRKGAQKELENRAQGLPPSTQLAKPLIDTGELRNSIKYAIRPRKR